MATLNEFYSFIDNNFPEFTEPNYDGRWFADRKFVIDNDGVSGESTIKFTLLNYIECGSGYLSPDKANLELDVHVVHGNSKSSVCGFMGEDAQKFLEAWINR